MSKTASVLHGEESDSDKELEEEEETFVPGVEDNQSIGSNDPPPDGDPIGIVDKDFFERTRTCK